MGPDAGCAPTLAALVQAIAARLSGPRQLALRSAIIAPATPNRPAQAILTPEVLSPEVPSRREFINKRSELRRLTENCDGLQYFAACRLLATLDPVSGQAQASSAICTTSVRPVAKPASQ
jgi:hypothetical protein